MIVRIIPPAIHVNDVQGAENFFRGVFELQVRERSEMPDGEGMVTHLVSASSPAQIKLLSVSQHAEGEEEKEEKKPAEGEEFEETKRVTAWSDDFAGDVDRFIANGAELQDAPAFTTSRTTYASFIGPEDYTVEVIAHRVVPRTEGG